MAAAAAAASLETIALPRARLDLAIASSPRSSLSIRGGELGLGLAPLPQFAGLRVSRRLLMAPSAAGATNLKADRRSTVICEVQETATEVPDVTKETWQQHVLDCARPVVIEFWAPWCAPCRTIHPVIAKLAKTYEGKLECFKINTDECPDLAAQYGVRSIPTIVMFKNGEKKGAVIGAVPEGTLVSCVDKFLGRYFPRVVHWCQMKGRSLDTILITTKSDKLGSGRKPRLHLGCERCGVYRSHNHKSNDDPKTTKRRRAESAPRKCNCSFFLKGLWIYGDR